MNFFQEQFTIGCEYCKTFANRGIFMFHIVLLMVKSTGIDPIINQLNVIFIDCLTCTIISIEFRWMIFLGCDHIDDVFKFSIQK